MVIDDDESPRVWYPIDTKDRPIPDIPEPGTAIRLWVSEAQLDYPDWGPERLSAYLRMAMARSVSADQIRYVIAVPPE